MRFLPCALSVIALSFPGYGCFAPVKKVHERTALEQQLVSTAVVRAVDRLEVEPLAGNGPYQLVVTAPRDSDADWVRSCVERRLFREGIRVSRRATLDSPILEAAVAFAGSEIESSLIGFPLFIPGIPVIFGAVSLYKSETQHGRARLGLKVWDKEGNLAGEVPEAEAATYYMNYSFLTFIGTFVSTDMEEFLPPGDVDATPVPPEADPDGEAAPAEEEVET